MHWHLRARLSLSLSASCLYRHGRIAEPNWRSLGLAKPWDHKALGSQSLGLAKPWVGEALGWRSLGITKIAAVKKTTGPFFKAGRAESTALPRDRGGVCLLETLHGAPAVPARLC